MKLARACPRCGREITYTLKCNFAKAVRRNSVCKGCCVNAGRFVPGTPAHNKGRPMSEATREKVRKARAKQVITAEHRRKLRLAAIEDRLRKKRCGPNYNPRGCRMIEEYGRKHGMWFLHAENGGELEVPGFGYFVDGYDPVQNVVIEVYERSNHGRSADRERDRRRQEEIVAALNCAFIVLWTD